MEKIINPKPINKSNFSEFGDVITTKDIKPIEINNGYAKRFDGIANLDTKEQNGEATISIFSALKRNFPMKIDMMEKHPLGSQAFIPLTEFVFVVVVARPAEFVRVEDLHAFVTNGKQGVNYHRGTWHMPLIAMAEGQEFLVVLESYNSLSIA